MGGGGRISLTARERGPGEPRGPCSAPGAGFQVSIRECSTRNNSLVPAFSSLFILPPFLSVERTCCLSPGNVALTYLQRKLHKWVGGRKTGVSLLTYLVHRFLQRSFSASERPTTLFTNITPLLSHVPLVPCFINTFELSVSFTHLFFLSPTSLPTCTLNIWPAED